MPLKVNRNKKKELFLEIENNAELQNIVADDPFRREGHNISKQLYNLLKRAGVKYYLETKHEIGIEVDARFAQVQGAFIGYTLKIIDYRELNKLDWNNR